MLALPEYVLITPARDEAASIELTLKSVVSQSVRPLKWIIVSDGSTDGTDEIVTAYVAHHPWIELLRTPERRERHFSGKVWAFNAGLARVANVPYQIICNLDGDVSFEGDYFEFLLKRFAENPRLGVAGTPFREGSFQYDFRFTSIQHVSGQCQLFRRECFEDIGGYIPRKIGGVDLVAVTTARMKGWETRTFLEKTYMHHRTMGTATSGAFLAAFKVGRADRLLGSHPVWQGARCIYQLGRRPVVIGGTMRIAGYFWETIKCAPLQVSPEFVAFRRAEQMGRLWKFLTNHKNKYESHALKGVSIELGRR